MNLAGSETSVISILECKRRGYSFSDLVVSIGNEILYKPAAEKERERARRRGGRAKGTEEE